MPPDLEELGFNDEQIKRWNAVAKTLQNNNKYSYKILLEKTPKIFRNVDKTDNHTRDTLLTIFEKAQTHYEGNQLRSLLEVLPKAMNNLDTDNQQKLVDYLEPKEIVKLGYMKHPIKEFIEDIPGQEYGTALDHVTELNKHNNRTADVFFKNAGAFYKQLDPSLVDKVYEVGLGFEKQEGGNGETFFEKSIKTFRVLGDNFKEQVVNQTQQYAVNSRDVAISYVNVANSVYGTYGENDVSSWINTADTFDSQQYKADYFSSSEKVLKQVNDKDKLFSVVQETQEKNESLALSVFKAANFIIDHSEDMLINQWIDIGVQLHDASSYVESTKKMLDVITEDQLTEWGDLAVKVSNIDDDLCHTYLVKSDALIRQNSDVERDNVYNAIDFSSQKDIRAAKSVIEHFEDIKTISRKDLKQWLNVGNDFDENLKETFFSHTTKLITNLDKIYTDNWVLTGNTFGKSEELNDYLDLSQENFEYLDKNSFTGKNAFEMTKKIASEFKESARDFYAAVPYFYQEDAESETKIRTWVGYGLEYERNIDTTETPAAHSFFKKTAGITTLLSKDELNSWHDVFANYSDKDILVKHSVDTLNAVASEHRAKMIEIISDLGIKEERLLSDVAGSEGAYAKIVPELEIDTLKQVNTLGAKIFNVDKNLAKTFFGSDTGIYNGMNHYDVLFEEANASADVKKATLAIATMRFGKKLNNLSEGQVRHYLEEARDLYEDDNSENYLANPDRLNIKAYGSYIASVPVFTSSLTEDDYNHWKDGYGMCSGLIESEDYLINSSIFFNKTDPSQIQELLEYNLEVMKGAKSTAIRDFKELPRLAKTHPVIKNMVLNLGRKLVEESPTSMDNYIKNTTTSLETLKTPEELGIVYSAEQIIEKESAVLAKSFLSHFGPILEEFDSRILVDWAQKGLEIYEEKGEEAADKFFQLGLTRNFIDELKQKYHYVGIEDISGAINKWIGGILGKSYAIAETTNASVIAYTDNKSIYLPKRIDKFTQQNKNMDLYWGLTDHEMAHILYGSFDVDIKEALKEYEKQGLAKHINNMLEDGRIEYNLRKDFGKVVDDELNIVNEVYIMKPLNETHPKAEEGDMFLSALLQKIKMGKTVTEYNHNYDAEFDDCYRIYKEEVEEGTVIETWAGTRKIYDIVAKLFPDHDDPIDQAPGDDTGDHGGDGQPVDGQPGDGGEGEPGGGDEDDNGDGGDGSDDEPGDEDPGNGDPGDGNGNGDYNPDDGGGGQPTDRNDVIEEYKFDEYDVTLNDYLYEWATVKEIIKEKAKTSFYDKVRAEKADLRGEIITLMEELKPEELIRRKRLPDGSDIDIDAYLDAYGEKKSGGRGLDENIYEDRKKIGRDVAVFVLIDQSGSTSGEIIKKEKEAVCLLGDALEDLGDQFAVYGFDSSGKDDVRVYRVKSFEESYDDVTKGRIEAMQHSSMTRMGPAIRFAMNQLKECQAEEKIFLYLSDGEPNDYGDSPNCTNGWGVGSYISADIRQAIKEGEENDIHSYCMTVDTDAQDYLQDMFGEGNYTVLNDVDQLPERLAEFYKEISR